MKRQDGFTLIEIVIAMTILAMISIAAFQTSTDSFALRDSLYDEGTFYNSLNLTQGILERDFYNLTNPLLLLPPQPSGSPLPIEGQAVFWTNPVHPSGLRSARLIGTETKLSFISTSHERMYRDMPESIYAKITYEVITDPTTHQKILTRTEDPRAFDLKEDVTRVAKSYELLHNIVTFQLTYLRQDGETWNPGRTWDSNTTNALMPDIIMITLTCKTEGASRPMMFDGILKFRSEHFLNGVPSTF